MFSNQICARDLYASNEHPDKCFSAERDFSQLQNAQFTQFDNSQCSQDFFSQTQGSSGSAESQGRRLQSVEKYMAKPSLFRTSSQGRGQPNRPVSNTNQFSKREPLQSSKQQTSFQQQMNMNINKAKERDERDMLSSIVHIVKECSDEVKHNLHVLRDGETENTENLKSSILSLTDQIRESSDKILKSVQSREKQVSLVEKLQRQLNEKDDKIKDLLKQLSSSCAQEQSKSMVEAMKSFMSEQQNETDKRLQKLLEATQEELKLMKEQMSAQRSTTDENNKNFQDMKYSTNRQIQDVEKRVVDELLHIRDDFERQKRDMESFYKNQLQLLQQKQTREITQHLDRGIENLNKTSTEFDTERHVDVLKDVCKSQQKDLQLAIKIASADQSKQYLKQNQDLFASYQKSITTDINEKLEDFKAVKETNLKTITDHIDKSMTDKSRLWRNDLVPEKVQAQLDELHNQHISETERLEKQIEEQKKRVDENVKTQNDQQVESVQSVLQNIYDFPVENQKRTEATKKAPVSLFQRASGFVSPRPLVGTTWNSRAIFGRTNPSPVATVLPQRKSTTDERSSIANITTFMPQPNNRHGTATHQLEQQGQIESQDHVVPFTPRGREVVQQNLRNIMIAGDTQELADNFAVPTDGSMAQRKVPKMKNVSKKKGRKKKSNAKKTKAIIKTYKGSVRKQETQDSDVRSTQAQQVYDFRDETSPTPVMRKSNTSKTSGPPSSSKSSSVPSVGRTRNWSANSDSSQSDDSSHSNSSCLLMKDVLVKRKVGPTDRTSPFKQEKETHNGHPVQDSVNLGDFLSTPNLTAKRDDIPETMDSYKYRRLVGTNRAVRSFEQKRRLCDFDSQVVNLIECIQKRKKIDI